MMIHHADELDIDILIKIIHLRYLIKWTLNKNIAAK